MSEQPASPSSEDTVENNNEVLALIEIPRGSRNKYEFDKETGVFVLDRVLYSSVHYPTDYGFVPNTLADDGDPLDICVLMTDPSFPGCYIHARPLGGLEMTDEKGEDFKLLAVPVNDPRFNQYRDLSDVGNHWLQEIEHFFATYKMLEGKVTTIDGWRGLDRALQEIEDSKRRHNEKIAGK